MSLDDLRRYASPDAAPHESTESSSSVYAATVSDELEATHVPADDRHQFSSQDMIIAVMGPTGVGKSSFINTATKSSYTVVGHQLRSCTREIQTIRCLHPDGSGRRVVFVDTPGFDDTELADTDILKSIATWLTKTYRRKILLSGLLYFHRISDNRMSGSPLRNLSVFRKLCGRKALQNVILVTTMWDAVSEKIGGEREAQLRQNYWNSMLILGSRMARFRHTYDSAWSIISLLSCSRQIPLTLQKEMVDQGLPLSRTKAGLTLFVWLEKLIADFREMLKRLEGALRGRTNGAEPDATADGTEATAVKQRLSQVQDQVTRLGLHRSSSLFSIRSAPSRIRPWSPDGSDNGHSPFPSRPASPVPSLPTVALESRFPENRGVEDPCCAAGETIAASEPIVGVERVTPSLTWQLAESTKDAISSISSGIQSAADSSSTTLVQSHSPTSRPTDGDELCPTIATPSTVTTTPDVGTTSRSQNRVSHPSHGHALDLAVTFLNHASHVADAVPFPFISGAVGLILEIAQSVSTMRDVDHELVSLAHDAGVLISAVQSQRKEEDLSPNMRQAMCDTLNQLKEVQRVVNNMTKRGQVTKYVMQQADQRVVATCHQTIRFACELFGIQLDLSIQHKIEQMKSDFEHHFAQIGAQIEAHDTRVSELLYCVLLIAMSNKGGVTDDSLFRTLRPAREGKAPTEWRLTNITI